MKKLSTVFAILAVVCVATIIFSKPASAQTGTFQTCEYVTIRWGGRDNTHLIRANGSVEFLKPLLMKATRPDRVDDRSFYMNIAMNAVAKEGYEFVGMTSDEIIMKRSVVTQSSK
jgi:hypothetical protein